MTVVLRRQESEKMEHGGYNMDIELCKEQIKRHEGEVLEVYEDSLGYKTLELVIYVNLKTQNITVL